MKDINTFYEQLLLEKYEIDKNLQRIERELDHTEEMKKSIVIKQIKNRLYYYCQWRESGRVKSEYLSLAVPGAAAEEERQIIRRQELLNEQKEQRLLKKRVEQMLEYLSKDRAKQKLLPEYTFEVFWKDEITARVHAKEHQVKVSRYVEHPVKQLFAASVMSRNQLNKILELRCFERGRPDIMEILGHLGLREYNPYEIVKRTHGVSYNDFIWFRFPGEKFTSKDVLVR